MWKDGLTKNTLDIFEKVSQLECIKDLYLCGGTGIALQLHHRFSEDLDFELLSVQGKGEEYKALNHGLIMSELKSVFGNVDTKGVATNNHFECIVGDHVKLSFYKPTYKVPVLNGVNILNNLNTVSLQDALGMKLYVITQRSKFRDYYDIYSLLKEGCSLQEGIMYAIKFSRHDVSSNAIVQKILSKEQFIESKNEGFFNFIELKAKYNVNVHQICDFIEEQLTHVQIKKEKLDKTVNKSIGRLFYETFTRANDSLLVSLLDKLPGYVELKNDENKIKFIRDLLSSVKVEVAPYDTNDIDLLSIRKSKDVNSLGRVNEILAEYNKFNALNAEITQQQNAINEAQNIPMDGSLKELLIANCNSKIETLKSQQVDLRFFQEFEIAEKKRHEIKVLEMSKDISNKIDKALDSEIETIKDKLESQQEDQEESNTKSVRRRR